MALLGAAGAALAVAIIVRRSRRRSRQEEGCDIPELELPDGYILPLRAMFALGQDSFQYGEGRLILKSCDSRIGIGSLTVLGQTNVMLRSPDLVQEVIKKNHQAGGAYGKSFRGSPFDPMIDNTFGRGLFFAEDQDAQWAVAHKILTKPFSHRGVLDMVPLMCEQADNLVAALEREIISGSSEVYMFDYMVKMALETIVVCSMGTRFNSFSLDGLHPFPVAFQKMIDAFFDLVEVPPQLWWCCFRTKAKMEKAVHVINQIIDDIIDKRVRGETSSSGKFPDLLDLMLAGEAGSKLSQENIRSQILTFLFAGHDSTAAAMSSFITFVVANPRVEAKLMQEIMRVVGDGEVEARHLKELTYLDWCQKETMRLLPPAGNYQRMAFQSGITLGDKWIVDGYQPVIIDVFALHHDPETWGADAAAFKPERWEQGPPHPSSYMPFASGPRSCIGKEFSLVEQKIVAVKLLQKFTMRRGESSTPRKGSVLIKASNPCPYVNLGIDAEFNPKQFFVGSSIPVVLGARRSDAATLGGA